MAKKKFVKRDFVAGVIAWLESALKLSQAFERLLVDVFVAYVPLLAPVIPATIAFFSLYVVLEMPLAVSLIGAGVVEFLGLGTVSTTMQFVDYNASRNEDDPPAPTKTAIGTMVFYLVVVLTVNVLLDDATLIHKVTKLLLSTLSVAGAVTISLRGQHARRLAVKALKDARLEDEGRKQKADETAYRRQVSAERRAQKHELMKMELELKASESKPEPVKVSEKVSESDGEKPATFGKWKTWRKVPQGEKLKIVGMTVEEVMANYGVEERTAYHWIEYAGRDLGKGGSQRLPEEVVKDLVAELSGELANVE